MNRPLLTLLCLICFSSSYSQTTTNSCGVVEVEFVKEKRSKKASAKTTIKQAFIGGDSLWLQSFDKRLNESLERDKRIKKGKYIVTVQFIIAKDSSIADIRPLSNDPGFGMTWAVMGTLMKSWRRPSWQGGGRPVQPYRRSAITYSDSASHRK